MFNMVLITYPIEKVAKRIAVCFPVSKLDAVIGKYSVDSVWYDVD